MRLCLASTLVLAFATATVAAQPRPMKDAAKQELQRGIEHYAAQSYAAAIAAFEAGYAIDPHPDFHYVKAQALRLSGDCRAAIASYDAFLATQPPAREADAARKNIAKCEQILASQPAPPEPIAPSLAPLDAHDDEDDDHDDEAPIAIGSSVATRTARRPWWDDRVGLSLAGGGGIALGVAGGFAVAARAAADRTALARDVAEWEDAERSWKRGRLVAGVAAGAGVALLAASFVRFSLRDRTLYVAARGGNGATVAIGGAW